ncbi:hypothetical protein GCM10025857_40880 [Alicyclobacillus contaminans]|nr:hypothetical protein GCM10025857_40880 [Alicyclobacillus contaminans]
MCLSQRSLFFNDNTYTGKKIADFLQKNEIKASIIGKTDAK